MRSIWWKGRKQERSRREGDEEDPRTRVIAAFFALGWSTLLADLRTISLPSAVWAVPFDAPTERPVDGLVEETVASLPLPFQSIVFERGLGGEEEEDEEDEEDEGVARVGIASGVESVGWGWKASAEDEAEKREGAGFEGE
jgi:hypothetical protein